VPSVLFSVAIVCSGAIAAANSLREGAPVLNFVTVTVMTAGVASALLLIFVNHLLEYGWELGWLRGRWAYVAVALIVLALLWAGLLGSGIPCRVNAGLC